YETLNMMAGYIAAVTCQPRFSNIGNEPNSAAQFLDTLLANVTEGMDEVAAHAREMPAYDAIENGHRVKLLLTHELSDLSDPKEIS
ncbi:hypothetical protein, partial [Escherichia coli]|uniref:hypothetical protein n=1 Tax=Escherichia coli TaxID=562 RepID=UPI003D079A3E